MANVAEIINSLIPTENNNVKYLEIGVWAGQTLSNVNCNHKDGVDPEQYCSSEFVNYKMTSDEFFTQHCKEKYDIIFVDGLHTAYQVSKDIYNSIKHIKPGGWLLLDDVYPHCEYEQEALDLNKVGAQTGDVWKAVYHIFETLKNICDVIKFVEIGRGLLMLKIKNNNNNNISIDPEIPTNNIDGWYTGTDKEWSRYSYKNDFPEYEKILRACMK